MTLRIDILDELIAVLNANLPVDIPGATKRRWIPGAPIRQPAIAVFFLNEDAEQRNKDWPVTRRSLRVVVQCLTLCDEPEDMDGEVEPLLAHVVSRLGFYTSPKVMNTQELNTKWEFGQMDKIYIAGSIVFNVDYQTNRTDTTKQS